MNRTQIQCILRQDLFCNRIWQLSNKTEKLSVKFHLVAVQQNVIFLILFPIAVARLTQNSVPG